MADAFLTRQRIETAALVGVLATAAFLRLFRLEDNGFGTAYYAAGVKSQLEGFALFFYNAFDPAGFVSLDKPPLAFWIQGLFAWVLGFNGWTVHLPQALAGVASVAVINLPVRRSFGVSAGLISAFLLAITPVAVAVDRSNNTDSWLVLFLLLAAGAARRGRGLSLVAAMALLGLAFNVKMLAALVCGPALFAGWLLASRLDWREQFAWAAAAGVTLVVVSLSWAVAFDLTPKESRPYAGSTTGNSMLELIVVHNGLERFVRDRPARPATAPTPAPVATPEFELFDAVPVGPLRLANPILAGQFAWLLPLALCGLVLVRRRDKGHASLVLWGLWAFAYAVVFSLAGGIFHLYYLSAMAPPLAALAGIGCVQLWRRGPAHLAAGLAAAALWQAYLVGASLGWDSTWMAAPLAALLASVVVLWRDKRPPAAVPGFALLILPLAWALSAVFSPANLTLPSSSLPRWLGIDDGRGPILSRNYRALSDDPKLHDFLLAHRGTARFLAAAPTATLAAPIIFGTGQKVMALGGYSGGDPILTVDAFADLVRRGEVRYVLLGNQPRQSAIGGWIRAKGSRVDESLWQSRQPQGRRAIQLYELKPGP